jgi:UDP-N-acetylmuramoyl-L-alanyl-D-glutamate--2,6-diaminopimelate ligase
MTELAFPSGLSRRPGVMGLAGLVEVLQPRAAHGFRDVAIGGLAAHHDEVAPGDLFFVVRGVRRDGAQFVESALKRGAVALVVDAPLAVPVTVPVLEVASIRTAIADAANAFHGRPSRRVEVVGITGTNGKTTVAHLLRACLEADRRACGLIGTTGVEYGGRQLPSHNTTPDPIRIHGYLREMAERKVQACAMEVSSHALMQERVRGVDFKAAVFTNLSQDHLDYHGDMRSYGEAKARLFRMLRPGAHACLASDVMGASVMADAIGAGVHVHRFGLDEDAEVRAEGLRTSLAGSRFTLVMPKGKVDLLLRLPGEHNVRNALAAASASLALGVSELTVTSALEAVRPVRGRLELAGTAGGVSVYVDYAHTPDALEKVCAALARLTAPNRLIVVFGCGGDRDRTKRPLMTQAVARHAAIAVMTSDNPRSEDPEAILDEMQKGLVGAKAEIFRVVDRAQAIELAVRKAEPGDTVLLAGKGHETYQDLGDRIVPFDDAHEGRCALERRFGGPPWGHR